MSDVCSSNCGCGCERDVNYGCGCERDNNYGCGCSCGCMNYCNGNNNGTGMSSCLWIILLLIFCGGCGNGLGCGRTNGCGDNSCLWIILLLIFCGGCGNNFGGCC